MNNNKSEDMPMLLKALKAVHSITNSESVDPEELDRQRKAMELFSHLCPSPAGLIKEYTSVDDIPIVSIRPDNRINSKNIILYCHGGGFTCGGLGYAQIIAEKLCDNTGLMVVAFEYKLAPENPYPAAINDTLKIWDYLMLKGYGAANVYLAGDSAGGNLALELCLELRKENRMRPRSLILFSPFTDMTMSGASYEVWKDKDPILTREYVENVRMAYIGQGADYSNPSYSPLFADLSNMPPALIQVGSNEILRSDSESLVKKLKKNGNFARLSIYKNHGHVFQQLPIKAADNAMEEVADFIKKMEVL